MEDSQEAKIQEATRIQGGEIKPGGGITLGKVTSTTGVLWVWDTRTYEKIAILDYTLPYVLRKRRPEDGSYQFTMNDPGKLPVMGEVKCILHPSDSNREHYDKLGFRTCKKANIKNRHEQEMHMKRRHSQEWETLEKERKEKEREEDRLLQRLLLAQGLKEQSNKPIEPTPKVEQISPKVT